MVYTLSVACGCNMGKVRKNNEDNFFFNGRSLPVENAGLQHIATAKYLLETERCFGVFDGMGGEQAGEVASYTACRTLKSKQELLAEFVSGPKNFLEQACEEMNLAVCGESEKLSYGRMGSTAAMLLFVPDEVYACNLGDSRIYRLRDNEFSQMSVDDVEARPNGEQHGKAPLTQYLGVFPDELKLEPHISKCELKAGDIYLICSDGLTDMLSNLEICACLKQHVSIKQSVDHLIRQALENGGRDNITVVLIKVA